MLTEKKLVAILLCTYNGEKFLEEQLDSILHQTHQDFILWVSDDGSNDGTMKILQSYIEKFAENQMQIISGPKEGCVRNFLSLICNEDIKADYYAFSDQDDIWNHDKLERALSKIDHSASVPVLYGSRTEILTKEGTKGHSKKFSKKKCFKNALVQSYAGGNTMVMNNQARNLLMEAGPYVDTISHDWWAYILVSGSGGVVIYDDYSSLKYRQHENNQIGCNTGIKAAMIRVYLLFCGNMKKWNDQHIKSLASLHHMLDTKNQLILQEFTNARKLSLIPRLVGLKRSGIYRQTLFGNLGIIIAAIFNKI